MFFLSLSVFSSAQSLTVTENSTWNLTIDSSNLTSGAGSALTQQYVSDASPFSYYVNLSIVHTGNWTIQVKITTPLPGNRMKYYVERIDTDGTLTDNGTPPFVVTDSYTSIFKGNGDKANIRVRVILDHVALREGPRDTPDSYDSQITFKVVDGHSF